MTLPSTKLGASLKKSPASDPPKKSVGQGPKQGKLSAKTATPIHNTDGGKFPDTAATPNKTTKEDSIIAFRKN